MCKRFNNLIRLRGDSSQTEAANSSMAHLTRVTLKRECFVSTLDRPPYLCSKSSLFSEPIELMKRLINQVREYWYMGSMLARSATKKNRMAEGDGCVAHAGLINRPLRHLSHCFSVISFSSTLEHERILTAVSSSRMLPSEEEST